MRRYKQPRYFSLTEALFAIGLCAMTLLGVLMIYSFSREASMIANANNEIATVFAKGKWGDEKSNNRFGGSAIFLSRKEGFVFQYNKIPKGNTCVNIVTSQRKVGWDFVVVGSVRLAYASSYTFDSSYTPKKVAALCQGTNDIEASTINLQFEKCVECQ